MKFQLPTRSFKVPAFEAPAFAKFAWERLTSSRLTILYLIFTLVHFTIQLSLQLRAFTINQEASSFMLDVLKEGNITTTGLPFQTGSGIRICDWVSNTLNVENQSCRTVWSADNAGASQNNVQNNAQNSVATVGRPLSPETLASSTSSSSASSGAVVPSTTTIFVRPTPSSTKAADDDDDDDDDDKDRRNLYKRSLSVSTTVSGNGESAVTVKNHDELVGVLDKTCLESLVWPSSVLLNTKREDITFVAFQFWVLGMSFIALLNESIPHILASLLTHVMSTAWAGFQITQTEKFRTSYGRIITNGACRAAGNLLPNFWEERRKAEYPSLALHIVALLISCALTWKLVKLYGWQTFKRVGASRTIARIYKFALILSITIQLSLFFMAATVSLWIDQLLNSSIGDFADYIKLYKASSITTLILLVPWLMMGWFAVRRELRLPMFFFLFFAILYLAGWGVMFFSTTFRYTFVTWRFFSVMAVASVALTCLSFIFGVICRLNFGKGLLRYLNAEQTLSEKSHLSIYDDDRKDIESVPFPETGYNHRYSQDSSTISADGYANPGNPMHPTPTFLATPEPAVTRNVTDIPQIKRSGSSGSNGSFYSYTIGNNHNRQGSQSSYKSQNSATKRWVIE